VSVGKNFIFALLNTENFYNEYDKMVQTSLRSIETGPLVKCSGNDFLNGLWEKTSGQSLVKIPEVLEHYWSGRTARPMAS